MQVSTKSSSLPCSQYALLRWFEGPQSDVREQYVEVVDDQICQTVVRSSLELGCETEVTLITKDCTAEGVVQACRSDNSWFLLTVAAKMTHRNGATRDPGGLVVDDFLSEEQEAAILAELNEQTLTEQSLVNLAAGDSIETASPWHTLQPGSTHGQMLRH